MTRNARAGGCAINDCPEPSVGVMEWPYISTLIELCQRHATYVGAVERFIDRPPDKTSEPGLRERLDEANALGYREGYRAGLAAATPRITLPPETDQ
jgi:hypothetical protein